ncbi:phosphotransferase family protein [Oceanirhabdus seepicola]|uniref:Phosphotransferase n=1 Tax=Oceanirhabdus seepicola TaxID=2828781 RepID=A0A9J6P350_9CLOT|nr:phosphotransferase [Oceanirhabdus seepicola]MCM1991178.1 phosphotransferase [Oceanirhabdus seepicola]
MTEKIRHLLMKKLGVKPKVRILNLYENEIGFSNDIAMFNLKFELKGKSFNKEVVFKDYSKEYKGNDSLTKFNKEVSIFNSEYIRGSINMPRVYFEDEEAKTIIMDKISGASLDEIYIKNPEKFEYSIKAFGNTLASIHFLDIEHIQQDVLISNKSSKEHFYEYIKSIRKRIECYEEPQYMRILEGIIERFKSVEFGNQCLNHGDFHFLNVIYTDEEKLFVLDWEKAKITDFRFDLANTLVLCYSWFGIDFKSIFLEAYENTSGLTIHQLEYFEALLSFDSLSKCLSLVHGYDDSHVRDKSFMWIKRRYELFVQKNGIRIDKVEKYLQNKGVFL